MFQIEDEVGVVDAMLKSNKNLLRDLLKTNLDFQSDKKKQQPRHYWHTFPAKFPPDLPAFFIENLTEPGQVVLDPMAGSCTTLLEAAMRGRAGSGFDIDPLSLLVGSAKLQNFNPEKAKQEGLDVLTFAQFAFEHKKESLVAEMNRRFDDATRTFLDYWWLPETQLELMALLLEIEAGGDSKVRDFLRLVFSSIIITKSGGVTLARDLAHTRPHKVADKKPSSAFSEFGKKLSKIFQIPFEPLPLEPVLREGNARALPMADESVDLVVTSPPYANNAIDYMRAHKFSLVWFGFPINQLTLTRKQYIGSEAAMPEWLTELPPYPQGIVDALTSLNKSKGRALHRYYAEMQAVIAEIYRVLKSDRGCIIVVATSILNGVDVETHHCLANIGEAIGFEVAGIGVRDIHRDSRMLPTSHHRNGSQIEARMHNEFVIGLWKN